MKDFESAKELFKDIINIEQYFDSMSSSIAKKKIDEIITHTSSSFLFIVGEAGVGKSFIMKSMSMSHYKNCSTLLINHPFFGKEDLLAMLYKVNNLSINPNIHLETSPNILLEDFETITTVIFIDEAHLLNENQLSLIRFLHDTGIFKFILALNTKESTKLLKAKLFQSSAKTIIEYGNLNKWEILRYAQELLIQNCHGDIASMFSKGDAKFIEIHTKGNFRTVKKFLYTLMKLLAYAKKNTLPRYQKLNNTLLTMTALEIGAIHDKP